MTEPSLSEVLESCAKRCREMDAPLGVRLKTFADDVRRLDPVFANVVDRMVAHLLRVEAGVGAPNVGEQFPLFVLPDQNGHLVCLERLLRNGTTVISFHRGHWCPYCRISADALAGVEPELRSAGAQLVIITPETQRFSRELTADAKATCPILTDLDCGFALDIGVAFNVSDEKRAAMTRAGFDISGFNGNSNWTLPIPATFVVGGDGTVRARLVDPDYRHRMGIEDIVRAVNS